MKLCGQLFFSQNSACPLRSFGQDCSKKCIDTCAGCNIVNGMCDSGCIPGWKGDLCKEGISNLYECNRLNRQRVLELPF